MINELRCYQKACEEFDTGQRDPETWAEALSMASGAELNAKYLYIHLRVEALTQTVQEPVLRAVHRPAALCQADTRKTPASANEPIAPRQASVTPADNEAALHAIATREIDSGNQNARIWKDALVLAKGDAGGARLHYICLRMDALRAMSTSRQAAGKLGS